MAVLEDGVTVRRTEDDNNPLGGKDEMESASTPDMPPAIVQFEILTRVSLEGLGRCRSVCKDWNFTTYDSKFQEIFYENSNIVSGFYIREDRFYTYFVSTNPVVPFDYKLGFLPFKVDILACTPQGLVCCQESSSRVPRYLVCKPTTEQWRLIPRPRTRFSIVRVAMMVTKSSPLRYKIIRISEINPTSFMFELFDSEAWRWKLLKQYSDFPQYPRYWSRHHVFVGGNVHWLLDSSNLLVSFDMEKELWTMCTIFPKRQERMHVRLVEYGGRLGVCCIDATRKKMELWLLEDYCNPRWRQHQFTSADAVPCVDHWDCTVIAFDNLDVIAFRTLHNVIFAHVSDRNRNAYSSCVISMDHSCPRMKCCDNRIYQLEALPFRSDMGPCDLWPKHKKRVQY